MHEFGAFRSVGVWRGLGVWKLCGKIYEWDAPAFPWFGHEKRSKRPNSLFFNFRASNLSRVLLFLNSDFGKWYLQMRWHKDKDPKIIDLSVSVFFNWSHKGPFWEKCRHTIVPWKLWILVPPSTNKKKDICLSRAKLWRIMNAELCFKDIRAWAFCMSVARSPLCPFCVSLARVFHFSGSVQDLS